MAKTFVGTVSSNAADKTIVVTVNTSKTHPLYHKQYTVSKKFMAHDEKNEAQVGDRVAIVETRPLSARKRYMLNKILETAAIKHVEAEVIPAVKAPEAEKPAVAAVEPKVAKKKATPEDQA
jgi:small subunit ribosomal protein S17